MRVRRPWFGSGKRSHRAHHGSSRAKSFPDVGFVPPFSLFVAAGGSQRASLTRGLGEPPTLALNCKNAFSARSGCATWHTARDRGSRGLGAGEFDLVDVDAAALAHRFGGFGGVGRDGDAGGL